jgi:hypothetical protein
MESLLKRIEITYWNLHVRILDESEWIRRMIRTGKHVWEDRKLIVGGLMFSLLGFPLGYLIGLLK